MSDYLMKRFSGAFSVVFWSFMVAFAFYGMFYAANYDGRPERSPDANNCMKAGELAEVQSVYAERTNISQFKGMKDDDWTWESLVALKVTNGQTITCTVTSVDLTKVLQPGMKINLKNGSRVL